LAPKLTQAAGSGRDIRSGGGSAAPHDTLAASDAKDWVSQKLEQY